MRLFATARVLVCLSLLIPSLLGATEDPALFPFKVGEELSYKVSWNGFAIGETKLVYWGPVSAGENELYKFTSSSDTVKYNGLDEIYANKDLLPVKVVRQLTFMGNDEHIVEAYEPDLGRVTITKTVNGVEEQQVIEKPAALQNSVLLYYKARIASYPETNSFDVILPTKEYSFKITRSEFLHTWDKEALVLESSPKGMRIWLEQAQSKTPLKMVFTKPFSVVTMSLIGQRYRDLPPSNES